MFIPLILILVSLQAFAAQPEQLIEHVQECIEKAEFETSSLNTQVLTIEGMSSGKVRHLLNNLCTFPQTCYLEIGCWKGSTLIAALYNNNASVKEAIAIDNWSEFGGPSAEFLTNVSQFLNHPFLKIYETDCFSIDKSKVFSMPVTLYFYDGNHEVESQEMAFTYFNDSLDDYFIAVIDDWNHWKVQQGTRSAFQKLHYEILYEKELKTPGNGDISSWWNGIYIAVIKKNAN